MTKHEILSDLLSVSAIIVSIAVWRTADTRATELRDKVVTYSVENRTSSTVPAHKNEDFEHATVDVSDANTIDEDEVVDVNITNTGALPTKDITLTISTKSDDGKMPPYSVELNPAVDREIVAQDTNLVIRLKNPLGPKSNIESLATFHVKKNHKQIAKGFTPKEASVASEVGLATLVASIGGSSSSY
jgi:hypothetical protein